MEGLLLAGYVLHAVACPKDTGEAAARCIELRDRPAPTSLYVCQRSMAVAVERVPAIPNEALGLAPWAAYHFVFECKPAAGSA